MDGGLLAVLIAVGASFGIFLVLNAKKKKK